MEMLVGRKVGRLDPQEILDRPGDVVTFPHLVKSGHGSFEPLLRRFCMLGEPDGNIGDETAPHCVWIEHRAIPGNDP